MNILVAVRGLARGCNFISILRQSRTNLIKKFDERFVERGGELLGRERRLVQLLDNGMANFIGELGQFLLDIFDNFLD